MVFHFKQGLVEIKFEIESIVSLNWDKYFLDSSILVVAVTTDNLNIKNKKLIPIFNLLEIKEF